MQLRPYALPFPKPTQQIAHPSLLEINLEEVFETRQKRKTKGRNLSGLCTHTHTLHPLAREQTPCIPVGTNLGLMVLMQKGLNCFSLQSGLQTVI